MFRTLIVSVGFPLAFLALGCLERASGPAEDEDSETPPPPAPHLTQISLLSPEPACRDEGVIVCEGFEGEASDWSDYKDNRFAVASDAAFGGSRSMRQYYQQGQVNAGWLAWFIGDHPLGGLKSGERFEEIHLRWYHKFQRGWPEAFPPKMARVRSHYVDCGWCFAWQEHLWLGGSGAARSDPVSNIPAPAGTQRQEGSRWLGQRQLGLDFSEHDGRWIQLEMRVKLNTPGESDGRITYWADGRQMLDRTEVNLRGAYTGTSINVVMIDTYWNDGSPAEGLKRWYDNVVVSTRPVGCAVWTLEKTEYAEQGAWEAEIARDEENRPLIWASETIDGSGTTVNVSAEAGAFSDPGSGCFVPSPDHVFRARQARGSTWSDWSEWMKLF